MMRRMLSTCLRRSLLALASASALVAAGPAGAAIVYNATLDTPYTLTADPWVYYGIRATGGNPPLTGNFALDKQFQMTLSAPAGMRFQIAGAPFGATGYALFADLWSLGFVSFPVDVPGNSITFAGAVGTAPVLTSHRFTTGSGASQMWAFAEWALPGPFEFESVTMTFDVPATFNHDFGAGLVPDTLRLTAYATYASGLPFLIPDPFMSVVPARVPEPGSFALACLALAGLGFAGRRRASPA